MVDATIIFTDLENFTTISENLDPAEVSEILTSYFGQTTKCILENKGTIIKYIGDAVFAAWGAPIDDPHHAIRAAETACDLRCLSELVVRGKTLRTRVGIHSGKVLAGNLGSTYRFDYTMIGDAVNFASRLESLNKYLRTQVLISDAVRQQTRGWIRHARSSENFGSRVRNKASSFTSCFVVATRNQGERVGSRLSRKASAPSAQASLQLPAITWSAPAKCAAARTARRNSI